MKNDKIFVNEFDKVFRKKAKLSKKAQHRGKGVRVVRHRTPPLYILKANTSKGKGNYFFNLDDVLFEKLKGLDLLSDNAKHTSGPFTADDLKRISDYLSSLEVGSQLPKIELSEDVQSQIAREIQKEPMDTWSEFSSVNWFDIVRVDPSLMMLGLMAKDRDVGNEILSSQESVGKLFLNGYLIINDPESFGTTIVEYLRADDSQEYRDVLKEKPDLYFYYHNEEKYQEDVEKWKKKVEKTLEKEKEKFHEYVEEHVKQYYPPDLIPDEGVVDEREIPVGADIDLMSGMELEDIFFDDFEYPDDDDNEEFDDDDETEEANKKESTLKVISKLLKLANSLDERGMHKKADALENAVRKLLK